MYIFLKENFLTFTRQKEHREIQGSLHSNQTFCRIGALGESAAPRLYYALWGQRLQRCLVDQGVLKS